MLYEQLWMKRLTIGRHKADNHVTSTILQLLLFVQVLFSFFFFIIVMIAAIIAVLPHSPSQVVLLFAACFVVCCLRMRKMGIVVLLLLLVMGRRNRHHTDTFDSIDLIPNIYIASTASVASHNIATTDTATLATPVKVSSSSSSSFSSSSSSCSCSCSGLQCVPELKQLTRNPWVLRTSLSDLFFVSKEGGKQFRAFWYALQSDSWRLVTNLHYLSLLFCSQQTKRQHIHLELISDSHRRRKEETWHEMGLFVSYFKKKMKRVDDVMNELVNE